MIVNPIKLEEDYRTHLVEKKVFKWSRNIGVLGALATTAAINLAHEMSTVDHAKLTGSGVGIAAVMGIVFERNRRQAKADAEVSLGIAKIAYGLEDQQLPDWARPTEAEPPQDIFAVG